METVAALLLAGALLLLVETVLPGLIAGILGGLCLAAAVVLSYQRFGPQAGNLTLLGVGVALLAGATLWVRFFPRSRLGKIFVSRKSVGDLGAEQPHLLHQTGTALTALRPSGTALLGDRRVDVVSEGPLIERGTPVRVIAVEGLRVVVRAT